MKQRVQSILFFLSALVMGLLFFMPLASYCNDSGDYYKLYVYGIDVISPNDGASPFRSLYTLPLLVLSVAVILLSFYISMSIFRAVKLNQFVRLFKLSRINVAIVVVLIATIFVYYLMKTGTPAKVSPSFSWSKGSWPSWGAFLPLVSLLMILVASSGLRKDINKVKSVDRIR